jgi:hypothetical protein
MTPLPLSLPTSASSRWLILSSATKELTNSIGREGCRLNLAGTKITDEALLLLGTLPNLEWVCVNRTQVTAAAVDRLREARPGITVMIGAEP